MIKTLCTLAAPLAVATAVYFAAAFPTSAQQDCMSNRDMQAAIAAGEIAPVAQVLEQAGIDRNTQVLSVEVCRGNGGWAYYVGVIDASGRARTLVLQASG